MVKKSELDTIISSVIGDTIECPDTREFVDISYCVERCGFYKGIYRRSFKLHGQKNVIWWCRFYTNYPSKRLDYIIPLGSLEIESII
jgi:hypothetical protein